MLLSSRKALLIAPEQLPVICLLPWAWVLAKSDSSGPALLGLWAVDWLDADTLKVRVNCGRLTRRHQKHRIPPGWASHHLHCLLCPHRSHHHHHWMHHRQHRLGGLAALESPCTSPWPPPFAFGRPAHGSRGCRHEGVWGRDVAAENAPWNTQHRPQTHIFGSGDAG